MSDKERWEAPDEIDVRDGNGTVATVKLDDYGYYPLGDIEITYNPRRSTARRWCASFAGLHFYSPDHQSAFDKLNENVRLHYIKNPDATLRAFGLAQ